MGWIKEKLAIWMIRGILKNEDNFQTRLAQAEFKNWYRRYEMDQSKKWYQSKTIIFNVLNALAVFATSMSTDKGLSPQAIQIWATVTTLINIGLRLITDKPIGGNSQ